LPRAHRCCSFDVDLLPEPCAPTLGQFWQLAKRQKLVRARNLSGGGVMMRELRAADGTTDVDVCMLAASDFGGAVPPAVLNAATGAALHQLVLALAKHLGASMADNRSKSC
jgi:hypothetical protein